MRLAAAALVITWFGAVAVVAATNSAAAALLTGGLLLAVGLLTRQGARLVDRRRSRVTLARRIALGTAIPSVQMFLIVVLLAAIMFVSTHDAILIALVGAFAAILSLLTTRTVANRLVGDVEAVRDGLHQVGRGRRDVAVSSESSEELAELAEATNAMTARLAAEERARSDLVAAISHDLRTPVTSLRLVAEALGDDILAPEERQRSLDRLRLHVTALSGLIDDLFELSRLEAGERSWSMERVDLAMLVGDTVEVMEAEAAARGIHISCEIPDGLPPVRASPEKLQRVLFNLLQNAITHTPAQGRITLLASSADGALEVEVADTGAGIPETDRPHVFDAFRQGAGRTEHGAGGLGLGLAISRAVVEAHDGRIWLEPTRRGTRVRFSIPLASAKGVAPRGV